uniref:Secreted protein n=1 Tax=Oryza brachyantha TaxID=4533 RepID=J3N9H6_ORYBR
MEIILILHFFVINNICLSQRILIPFICAAGFDLVESTTEQLPWAHMSWWPYDDENSNIQDQNFNSVNYICMEIERRNSLQRKLGA